MFTIIIGKENTTEHQQVKKIVVQQTREYEAYLLRFWPVNGESTRTWRASLENAHSGEVVYFAAMDDLFEFIRDRTDADQDLDDRGPSRDD